MYPMRVPWSRWRENQGRGVENVTRGPLPPVRGWDMRQLASSNTVGHSNAPGWSVDAESRHYHPTLIERGMLADDQQPASRSLPLHRLANQTWSGIGHPELRRIRQPIASPRSHQLPCPEPPVGMRHGPSRKRGWEEGMICWRVATCRGRDAESGSGNLHRSCPSCHVVNPHWACLVAVPGQTQRAGSPTA